MSGDLFSGDPVTSLQLAVAELGIKVDDFAIRMDTVEGILADPIARGYKPLPALRVWQLDEAGRDAAVSRLRAWVADVLAPTFGHLAARLPICWDRHDLIVTHLDVMSELHSVLWLKTKRTAADLGGQAEYLLRLLPAAVDLWAAEGRNCQHRGQR